MNDRRLSETLGELRTRVMRYSGRGLNEQNTKATLTEPVLRALGWDLEDLEVNGWTFWQFRDADGKARELATLREQFERRSRLKVVG